MESYNPAIPGCTISYGMVAKHVNKKNAGKTSVLAINALLHSLLLLLRPSVLLLSIVTFNNDKSHRQSEFDVSQPRPRLGGLSHLETFTWQNYTPAGRVTRSGRPGYPPPHLRDQSKMRD